MKVRQEKSIILEKFCDAVKKDGLITSGDRVLVAFSGGADSVALLLMLHSLLKKLNIELFAAHLNHGIRGEEADRDERFCAELCGKKRIPIKVGHVSVPSESEITGEGLEECARRLRYDFLNECAEIFGCTKIATAHHADDNIETVLLHLIRGTGLSGLAGISAKRGNIIRPLLSMRKRELIAYLEENGQDYVVDSTNSDTVMTRNKIRHELLDTVYEINPRADVSFSNMSKLVEADNEYLMSLAERVDKSTPLSLLKETPTPLLSRFIQLRYAEYLQSREEQGAENGRKAGKGQNEDIPQKAESQDGDSESYCVGQRSKKRPQLSFVHINPVIEFIKFGSGNADFPIPGNAVVHVSSKGLVFTDKSGEACDYETPLKYGENDFSQLGYKILITNDKNVADGWQNVYKTSTRATVKFGKICNGDNVSLYARNRKSGDAYVYGGHTRDVRRRLIDLKIPAYERSSIPCICDGEGVVWVPNLRPADRLKCSEKEDNLYIVYAKI